MNEADIIASYNNTIMILYIKNNIIVYFQTMHLFSYINHYFLMSSILIALFINMKTSMTLFKLNAYENYEQFIFKQSDVMPTFAVIRLNRTKKIIQSLQ